MDPKYSGITIKKEKTTDVTNKKEKITDELMLFEEDSQWEMLASKAAEAIEEKYFEVQKSGNIKKD